MLTQGSLAPAEAVCHCSGTSSDGCPDDLSVLSEGMGKSRKKESLLCLSQSLLLTYPKRIINSVSQKEHLEAERWVAPGPGPRMRVKAWPFL